VANTGCGDRNDDLSSLEAEVSKGRRWDVVIERWRSLLNSVAAS